MQINVIIPTHIWEFEPVIRNWFERDLGNIWNLHFKQGEAPSGRNVRQWATDYFSGYKAYFHFLDCDNLVSPAIMGWLELHQYRFEKEPKIIMFGQIWNANGIKRLNAKPENCVPARCDIAQLFVHGKFLKDMVWSADYENDGQFINELYKRYPNDFVFVNDVNAWYNCLRPNSQLYNGQIITIA